MIEKLRDRLRGACRLGLYAGLALACALLLIAMNGARGPGETGKTPLETRVEGVLSQIEGVGAVSVMITEDEEGEIIGAVIVANRLHGLRAALDVQEAVRTGGATNGAVIHLSGEGVPCIVIGIPVRYSHTHYGDRKSVV